MKRSLLYIFIGAAIATLTACDEGDITDEVFVDETESYVVKFTGDISGVDRWAEDYDIVLAAFDGESDYSVIQKQVTATDDARTTLILSGVPTTARSIEFCVTNKLRRRVISFESLAIDPSEHSPSDTLRLDLTSPINVGMFASIQRYIFDGAAYNCSLCHGAENGRAGLDLTQGRSHENLVSTASTRVEGGTRVVPGNASASVLHSALAEGNPAGLRYDHSGLIDDVVRRLIDDWIDAGAKD
ncbi:MAG: hypothetical protein Q4D23_09515 [Bacteroidales bacterium]|nr:hypothetical protein [Bacteroidales bacterium]